LKIDNCETYVTSPLHIAARASNKHAVHLLVDQHDFNVNILVNKRSFLLDLMDNSGLHDHQCLQKVFASRRPEVNAGAKLPLIRAIQRGNPYIIDLILTADPNPYTLDDDGKSPIHVAALKHNLDCFERLVKMGFDPMLPDREGNTLVHLICQKQVKEKDYNFLRHVMPKYGMRLSRNHEQKTPLNLVKKFGGREVDLQGKPNYSRKLWEWFEMVIDRDPNMQDTAMKRTKLQEMIYRDQEEDLVVLINTEDDKSLLEQLE
jgi:hypothetical protein